MDKTKYGKYIISDDSGRPQHDSRENEDFSAALPHISVPVAYLDDKVVKGSFYAECIWFHTVSEAVVEPHTHDFDEILAFFGSNPKDYHDLGGEVELWLDDEKHLLTKSCMVFIPKGLQHCPMILRRIDTPIFHFSAGPARDYDKNKK
jgi:hypothetical protein